MVSPPVRSRLPFVRQLAEQIAVVSPCRSGFMTLILSLQAAAHPTPDTQSGGATSSPESESRGLLEGLRVLVEESRKHFNPNFRNKACGCLLDVAARMLPPSSLPLPLVALLLTSLPPELVRPAGTLPLTYKK